MGARERWGYQEIKKDEQLILTYYFSENDGARFLRRGPERSVSINFSPGTDQETLEWLLQQELPETISKHLERMRTSGVITSGDYPY